jgi:hypothetical protein
VAIQQEFGLWITFVGFGKQSDDLQPFDAKQFAMALFEESSAPATNNMHNLMPELQNSILPIKESACGCLS